MDPDKKKNVRKLKRFLILFCCVLLCLLACRFFFGSRVEPTRELSLDGGIQVRIEPVASPPYRNSFNYVTNSDGSSYAYQSSRTKYFTLFNNILRQNPQKSDPDSDECVVLNGKTIREYLGSFRFMFTPNDIFFVFSRNGGQWKYIIDKVVYLNDHPVSVEGYDSVIDLLFLPNNEIMYIVKREGNAYCLLDNKEIEIGAGRLVAIVVSPQLDRIAYGTWAFDSTNNSLILFCTSDDGEEKKMNHPFAFGEGNNHVFLYKTCEYNTKYAGFYGVQLKCKKQYFSNIAREKLNLKSHDASNKNYWDFEEHILLSKKGGDLNERTILKGTSKNSQNSPKRGMTPLDRA